MIIKAELSRIYRLYHKYSGTDICYDVYITSIGTDKVYFLISSVFLDFHDGRFTKYMDRDTSLVLLKEDFNLFNAEEVLPELIKKNGNCPTCGLKGDWIRTALTCRRHGMYAGF